MRKSSAKKAPGARQAQEEELLVFHVSLLVLFCILQKNAKMTLYIPKTAYGLHAVEEIVCFK